MANKNKISLISFLALLMAMVPVLVLAEDTAPQNIGFPSQSVWFSKDMFLEGEEVTIHALVLNDTQGTFSGNMEFYDRALLLGKVPFSVTKTQKVKIVSFVWKATAGNHNIFAQIGSPQLTQIDGKMVTPSLLTNKTAASAVSVEQDANHNGIADPKEIVSATGTPDAEVFGRGITIAKNAIPDSVKNTTESTLDILGNFRAKELNVVDNARLSNLDRINALNQKEIAMVGAKSSAPSPSSGTKGAIGTGTPETFTWTDQAERPLRYVYWGILAIIEEILSRGWLYYTVLILVACFLLRFVWRKVRGRE